MPHSSNFSCLSIPIRGCGANHCVQLFVYVHIDQLFDYLAFLLTLGSLFPLIDLQNCKYSLDHSRLHAISHGRMVAFGRTQLT